MRYADADYADGVSAPSGGDRANPRAISNLVAAQGALDIESERNLSSFVFQWGQFLDHDMNLTDAANPAQPYHIAMPLGDPQFDPFHTGTEVMPLNRSAYDPATGGDAAHPREQVNSITSFIDGSMVYGSDSVRANLLREHVKGRMLTSHQARVPPARRVTFFRILSPGLTAQGRGSGKSDSLRRRVNRVCKRYAAAPVPTAYASIPSVFPGVCRVFQGLHRTQLSWRPANESILAARSYDKVHKPLDFKDLWHEIGA